jgi:hypothetical protein
MLRRVRILYVRVDSTGIYQKGQPKPREMSKENEINSLCKMYNKMLVEKLYREKNENKSSRRCV